MFLCHHISADGRLLTRHTHMAIAGLDNRLRALGFGGKAVLFRFSLD